MLGRCDNIITLLPNSRARASFLRVKLSNLKYCEIVPRFILAMVDGNSSMAKLREKQLMDATWRNVQTQQFTNTKDSAWSIVDTILHISPTKLCYIQDELDRICDSLPKQFPMLKNVFLKLFKFLSFVSSK